MINRITSPSDPSTYKYTDEEWAKICNKEAFTSGELMESVRRNGICRMWADDIYVSNIIKEDDILNDGWRN